jgi:hypothetical protein
MQKQIRFEKDSGGSFTSMRRYYELQWCNTITPAMKKNLIHIQPTCTLE